MWFILEISLCIPDRVNFFTCIPTYNFEYVILQNNVWILSTNGYCLTVKNLHSLIYLTYLMLTCLYHLVSILVILYSIIFSFFKIHPGILIS